MNIEYKLFNEITDPQVKARSLEISNKWYFGILEKSGDALVALNEEGLCGLVFFSQSDFKNIHAKGIFVEEELQRKGIGLGMWGAFVKTFREKGYKKIITDTIVDEAESLMKKAAALDTKSKYEFLGYPNMDRYTIIHLNKV